VTFHPTADPAREPGRSARALPADDGQPFVYTPENRARLEEIAGRYPPDRRRSAILAALFLAQLQHGHVTAGAIRHVADVLGCTPAEVEEVASYHTMISTAPRGRYVVQVCRTLSCALRGAEQVVEALAAALGTPVGGTDPSGTFTLLEVECLGGCDRGPVVMVNDCWHEGLRPEDAGKLAEALRARGEAAASGCQWQAVDD